MVSIFWAVSSLIITGVFGVWSWLQTLSYIIRCPIKKSDYIRATHINLGRDSQFAGKQYLWWIGPEPMLTITDPEVIKEILLNKNGITTKSYRQLTALGILFGKGLVSTIGEEWSLHRRIVTPAFHHERIKVTHATSHDPLSSYKADVSNLDTLLSAPTSRRVWNISARWLAEPHRACSHLPHISGAVMNILFIFTV